MSKYKFTFLILHYITLSTTIECIESIKLKVNSKYKYSIVVVDNGSPNDSGAKLKLKYAEEPNVIIILCNENLGFAKGNNIGFDYAKNVLKTDFICMMNNDTVMIKDNFIDLVYEVYDSKKYAVIGPKIILKNGMLQPLMPELYSRLHYSIHRYIIRIELFLLNLNFNIDALKCTLNRFIKINNKSLTKDSIKENTVLHGCCLIFTPIYIKEFNGLNDKTFLFREEELLYISLIKKNMTNAYYPDISILHLEDVATNALLTTSIEKQKFIYSNQLNSLKILIEEMKVLEKFNEN